LHSRVNKASVSSQIREQICSDHQRPGTKEEKKKKRTDSQKIEMRPLSRMGAVNQGPQKPTESEMGEKVCRGTEE